MRLPNTLDRVESAPAANGNTKYDNHCGHNSYCSCMHMCVELEWDFVYQPQHLPCVNSRERESILPCILLCKRIADN